jgi:hypothetical protein
MESPQQALKLPPGPLPFPGKLTDGKYDIQYLDLYGFLFL